jgi:hypothetical protein
MKGQDQMRELTLQEVTDKMDRLKSDISKKEGERDAVWTDLSKEFAVKTLDAAYSQLEKLQGKIDILQEKKQELMASVQKRLAQYGY